MKNASAKPATPGKPRLLSGDNPQIAMAEGDAPVQAYIAAGRDRTRPLVRPTGDDRA